MNAQNNKFAMNIQFLITWIIVIIIAIMFAVTVTINIVIGVVVIIVIGKCQLRIVQWIFICICRSVRIIIFAVSQNIRRTVWIRINILHGRKGHIHDLQISAAALRYFAFCLKIVFSIDFICFQIDHNLCTSFLIYFPFSHFNAIDTFYA